jgi:hypothetical protein
VLASPEGAAPRGGGGGGGSVLAALWTRVPGEALRLAENDVWAAAVLRPHAVGMGTAADLAEAAPPPRHRSTLAPTPPPRAAGRW